MNFFKKYKIWLFLLALVGIILASALYVSSYEKGKLEECKKDAKGIITFVEEGKGGSWSMQYKYTVGSTEYVASETIASKSAVKFFALGQSIDVYYSCTNPKVSRSKKVDE